MSHQAPARIDISLVVFIYAASLKIHQIKYFCVANIEIIIDIKIFGKNIQFLSLKY